MEQKTINHLDNNIVVVEYLDVIKIDMYIFMYDQLKEMIYVYGGDGDLILIDVIKCNLFGYDICINWYNTSSYNNYIVLKQ